MKCIINNQVVLSQTPVGPLAPYIESFAKSVTDQGYARPSICRKVLLAACFSRWLKDKGIERRDVTSDHPLRYLRYRARRLSSSAGDVAALTHFLSFLRRENIIRSVEAPVRVLTSVDRCVQVYEHYLRDARGLAPATIVTYLPFIRQFLSDRFGSGPVALSRLSADDVVRFVQRQARCLHKKRAKILTSALRSFLRYARSRGTVRLDLVAAVPIVANWSMTSIPRAIGKDQVRQLLASIDRRTAMGRRDYAVVLLLARLGLRSGEVASLTLDDFDWKAGQLNVHGKGGQRTELPLSAEVGQAIAAYLRDGRPKTPSRRLFLRVKAPVRGFLGASGVGSIVRHTIDRAGIDAPTRGAHQFRHGLATEMLRGGASLSEIGEVLGHRHPQTTQIYAKVDIKALRTLAMPWPGGAR